MLVPCSSFSSLQYSIADDTGHPFMSLIRSSASKGDELKIPQHIMGHAVYLSSVPETEVPGHNEPIQSQGKHLYN